MSKVHRPAPKLTARALNEYRRKGWRITAHRHPDPGTRTGPCARCGTTTVLYGPTGNPLCPTCRNRRNP